MRHKKASFYMYLRRLKGIAKRAELYKCDIRLVSKILSHKRIFPSLKEWRFMTFDTVLTGNFQNITKYDNTP